MRCPACEADVVEGAVFCHKCGERVAANIEHEPPDTAAERLNDAVRRPAADAPEQDLWQGGYGPKAMVGAWIGCGLLSAIILMVGIWFHERMPWWLILIAIVLPWLYCLGLLVYRRLSVRYRLTTRRFIHERGILRRVNGRIELLDIDDVEFEQGLLERLLGVGTIRVTSTDRTDPGLVMPGIERVKEVAGQLDNARLAERRRRGLHVEQI